MQSKIKITIFQYKYILKKDRGFVGEIQKIFIRNVRYEIKQIDNYCYQKLNMDDFTFSGVEDNFFEDEPQIQSCLTSYFQLQDHFEQQKVYITDCKNKQLKDTADSQSPETDQLFNAIEQIHKEGLFTYVPREINRIEIKDRNTKNQYIQRKRGYKKQTSELTLNYKILLKNSLQQYLSSQELLSQEKQIIQHFISSDGNLSNFRRLFGVVEGNICGQQKSNDKIQVMAKADRIRQACIKSLSESSSSIKILKNNKMVFCNKVTMLRFLQVLRKGCVHPEEMFGWKIE